MGVYFGKKFNIKMVSSELWFQTFVFLLILLNCFLND